MQLNRAEDYRFVIPDDDAKEGGAHPLSGDILPLRGAGRKDILSYEDICFLQEACSELTCAMSYLVGEARSLPPSGFTVPRALYGAEVGRIGFEKAYRLASSFAWHCPVEPETGNENIKQFFDNVGHDMKRLFPTYAPTNPRTGQSLDDLVGWESDGVRDSGYWLYQSWSDKKMFDVFYTLVVLAGSLKTIVAPADPGIDVEKPPRSFGAYYVGWTARQYSGTFGIPWCVLYDALAFHQGLSFSSYTGLGLEPGSLGDGSSVFVRPDYDFPSISQPVLTVTSDFEPWNTGPHETTKTFVSGTVTATFTEIAAEDMTVVHTEERPSAKLEYAALEQALGCRLIDLDMDDLPRTDFDLSEIAGSPRVSREMLEYAFRLPALCRRLFVPHFNPYYAAYRGGGYFFQYLGGSRSVEYQKSASGEVIRVDDPLEPKGGRENYFPGIRFEKTITLSGRQTWNWDYQEQSVYLSSERYTSSYGITEYGDPTDGSVVTVSSPTVSSSNAAKALCPESASDGRVVGAISCVVFAEVDREIRAWTSASTVEASHVVKVFPIRYSLTSPSYKDGRIQWMPSKSAREMVNEALGLCGLREDTVFDTSVVTSDERPPYSFQDGRLPTIPSPGAYGGNCTSEYVEKITVRFSNSVLPNGSSVHMALADVRPRTADQK